MKKPLAAILAVIGLASGAWAATINLSDVTSDTTIADGDTLTGTLARKCKISIAEYATVTLSDVTITTNSIGTAEGSWAGITCRGNATIILSGVNTVHGLGESGTSGYEKYFPGIAVAENKKLILQGDGSLTAVGANHAAGIGGVGGGFYSGNIASGSIVVESGDITAIGGYGGAGIGSGRDGSCGTITINGGIVTATGGNAGAGIGGGRGGVGGGVTINGGVVTAIGGSGGAGIGSGRDGSCGDITIKVGTVVAIGGDGEYQYTKPGSTTSFPQAIGGAGIGSGSDSSCGNIVIDGGTITATGGVVAAGIGTGTGGSCGAITLNYGWIVAKGGGGKVSNLVNYLMGSVQCETGGAGVGSGYRGACGDITINGGTVIAHGGWYAAAIGSGGHESRSLLDDSQHASTCGNISITLATGNGTCVYADAGGNNGIGAGHFSTCGEVSLADGLDDWNVVGFRRVSWDGDLSLLTDGDTYVVGGTTLRGTFSGAGKLTIASDAAVTLDGASIVGYNNAKCPWAGLECAGDATIYLTGNNTVKGYYKDHPGIHVPVGKTLTFMGSGSLAAYGGGNSSSAGASRGAGIGGGYNISCGNIVIASGDITAVGGQYAAGIGGGYGAACGSVTISNGISHVTATGGASAPNPIGKGSSGSGGVVKVESGLNDETIGSTRHIGVSVVKLDALTAAKTVEDGATLTGSFSSGHYKISIADGATVTLSGLEIYGQNDSSYLFAGLECLGDATIILEGDNTVDGYYYYPGIFVPEGKTLTIKGDGSLTARSSNKGIGGAAGIGGGHNVNCGNIVIESGSVIAVGGSDSPGIGSGPGASCGTITIGPGIRRVEATRGPSGLLPIGRSTSGTCGDVTVDPSLCDRTTTSENTQTRHISTGNLGLIAEDTLFANGAVLTGTLGGFCRIGIAGGTVTLKDVNISGMNVAGYEFAGLTCFGNTTLVLEGENVVKGFVKTYPGIHVVPGKTLTIKGSGSLTAQCSDIGPFSISPGGAGIGGGYKIDCGNIVIEGGVIDAIGGPHAAGIGGGDSASCGNIAIKGGEISAQGGSQGAGIGSGRDSSCGNIDVYSGVERVTATRGDSAYYSIGAGVDASVGTVTIGGVVGAISESPFTFPIQAIQAGMPVDATLSAFGYAAPSGDEPYTFTVKGLPTGLKYDSKTGKITGKATKPGIYEVTVTAKGKSKATTVATLTIKVANFTDAEIPVEDAYGPYIPGVEYKVQIPAAAGCSVSGLPSGMKWTAKDILKKGSKTEVETPANSAYGAATKPGSYTVYFTKTVNKVKHTATATFKVSAYPVLTVVTTGNGTGKVTGAGAYAANKKVTLKATADTKDAAASGTKPATKKSVFQGWYDGLTLLSQSASFSYVMPNADVTLTAKFITAQEDAADVSAILDSAFSYDAGNLEYATSIPAGVYLEWPLEVLAQSQASVAVSGLPSGLKFTAKDIVDSKTKAVAIPANTIYGTPTAASKTDKNTGNLIPSKVKIAITTAGKTKVEYRLALAVTPVEDWAVGTFNGGGDAGQLTLTVAATGKISGKYLSDGQTWTLSAANFYDFDELTPLYSAELVAKSGSATETLTLEIGDNDKMEGYGEAEIRDASEAVLGQIYQTNWKVDPWKNVAKPFAGAAPYAYAAKDADGNNGEVTLKFASSGAITAKGVFVTGKDSKGNDVKYTASGSATLIPVSMPDNVTSAFDAKACIYFPPKAGKFAGYASMISLKWDGAKFN